MKKLCAFVFVFALFLAAASVAVAQTENTTGRIQGTVTDPSGAVVPGADVEVRNVDTNFTRKLTTDGDGRFVTILLPPGRYKVTVYRRGFATLVQENVELTVGQTINLPVEMRLSTAVETITVTGTPTVESVKVESSTTLNNRTIANTPILGRKFEDFLTLTPGVSITQGPDGDEINFNGQRGIFNNISLDGGDYINGFFGEQVGGQRAVVDITLDSVQEFQVIATGGSAEYGRTAGAVVNVITKSGKNDFFGTLYHFQRLEALTSDDSLGRPLKDFHREQSGGTLGGPFAKDKAFWFVAVEQINGNLERPNLSIQTGATPCPVSATSTQITSVANFVANAAINGNADCQRLGLINFMRTTRSQEEGNPVRRPFHNTAVLGRVDWEVTPRNRIYLSYNFNRSIKLNETFDVDTYGNSANGTEGSSRIQTFNFNIVSHLTPRILSEGHFTYLRELRPRAANISNVPADTAMGFATTFRFGHPFFLNPTIDELFWRTQIRDNITWVASRHTVKFGGEWVHSLNDQIFRGFFEGRYIFDSVVNFLRYASPGLGAGFGPNIAACANGTYIAGATLIRQPGPDGVVFTPDDPTPRCTRGADNILNTADDVLFTGGPLLLFLQGAGRSGPATDAAGASKITNQEYAAFVQDKWQIWRNFTFNYGLRWEAQIFPNPVVPPIQTAYGIFLDDPRFPSDGTLHSDKVMLQPRVGFAWDPGNNGRSVLRASWGIYNARQNMLSQVGSITANGVTQQTIFRNSDLIGLLNSFGVPGVAPPWPRLTPPPTAGGSICPLFGPTLNQFPCFTGVRVFSRDYRNPRIYSTSVAYEFELIKDVSVYAEFAHSKGVFLTRFLDENFDGRFAGPVIGSNLLGEVMTASARGKSLYRGFTAGLRKRFSNRFQLEGNYVYSRDYDDDSNERDPFTDRACNNANLQLDYALADRDITHKFNFFSYHDLPWKIEATTRFQARSAQPEFGIVTACGTRNNARKDNQFFSFDWRISKTFNITERFKLIPTIEMFNTFNNENNINPLSAPALFDFSGFLRQGVGDPRQVQIAIKLAW